MSAQTQGKIERWHQTLKNRVLACRISVETTDTKVIFITGFAAVALNYHASQQADAKFLSKPFHLRTLVDEINRVLAVA